MTNKNLLIKKIILLFIILLTPILSIGIYGIKKTNNKLQDTILSSIHTNNLTYISQLDNTLKQIYFSNVSLLNQNFISHLAYLSSFMSDYEEGIMINLLREQLSTICNTQPFVESVQIFFRTTKRIYNSPGYPLGSFLQIGEEYNNILNDLQKKPDSIHYYTNPLTHNKSLSIFSTSSPSNLDYGMILNLSQKEIKDYLESNIAYLNDYYIFNLNHNYTLTNLPQSLYIEGLDFLLSLQYEDNIEPYQLIYLDNSPYYIFCYPLSYSKGHYIRFISAQNFSSPLKLNTLLLNILFIVVSIACITFFIVIYQLVHKPLRQLTKAFIELEQGNFNIQIKVTKPLDFTYLFSAFNNMTIQLKQLIEKDYNQKILLQKAELKQLQSQINPHFLYNSFFMLQRMIKMNLSEEALQVSNALGVYFKYITKNSLDYVTLYEEYEHTKTYAYIQGLRFEGRIDILFEVLPSDCTSIKVPKLILQPIVENAFNYGLSNTLENGLLKVHFKNSPENLKIIIEDNGEGISDVELFQLQSKLLSLNDYNNKFETTGLLNIQKRLIIFSNELNGLNISHSDLGGLCITITLSKISL